jgi:hypothetical protein
MTPPPAEPTAVQLCQNRARLRRTVRDLLTGSGLEIRERDKELVISNPRAPEKGRVHITYAAGEVSLRQTIWNYWGYLGGYSQPPEADPDSEPGVTASKIIAALGGQG